MPDDIEKEFGLSDAGEVGMRELARQLGKKFGGIKGMAEKIRETWENPDTPANVKHSIMALVLKVYAQQAEEDAKADFSSMSRDDLVAYIKRLMAKHDNALPEVLEPPSKPPESADGT